MGALIESWATVGKRRKGALELADRAASACLSRAGRSARDVDLLINAGVFRDANLGEPALAALVQDDIGANLRQTERASHGTFSFDVEMGGAGVVHALHLCDAFLADSVELALVVASDAHPGTAVAPSFPYAPVGGALLLVPGAPGYGFVEFRFDTYPEFEALSSAHIDWTDGENVLVIDDKPGYAARAVECAAASIRRFTAPRDLDLLVTSQVPGRFADALCTRLELPGDRVAHVAEDRAGAHTAGLVAAYEAAELAGRVAEARQVLFVGVGAGIGVALARYVPPRPARDLQR